MALYRETDIYKYVLNSQADQYEDIRHITQNGNEPSTELLFDYKFFNQTNYVDSNKTQHTLPTISNISDDGIITVSDIGFSIIKTDSAESRSYNLDTTYYTLKVYYPTKQLELLLDPYKESKKKLIWDETDSSIQVVDSTENMDDEDNIISKTVFARHPGPNYIDYKASGFDYNDSFKPNYVYKYELDGIPEEAINVFNAATGTLSLDSQYIKNNASCKISASVIEEDDNFFIPGSSINTTEDWGADFTVRFKKVLPMKYTIEDNTQIVYLNEAIEKGFEEEEKEAEESQTVSKLNNTPLTFNFYNVTGGSESANTDNLKITLHDVTSNKLIETKTGVKQSASFSTGITLGHTFKMTIVSEAGKYKVNKIYDGEKSVSLDNLSSFNMLVTTNGSTKNKAIKVGSGYFGTQDPSGELTQELIEANPNIAIKNIKIGLVELPKEYAVVGFRIKDINGNNLTIAEGTSQPTGTNTANAKLTCTGSSQANDCKHLTNPTAYPATDGYIFYQICTNYGYKYTINVKGNTSLGSYSKEYDTDKKGFSSSNFQLVFIGFTKKDDITFNDPNNNQISTFISQDIKLSIKNGTIKVKLYYNPNGTKEYIKNYVLKLNSSADGSSWDTAQKTASVDTNGVATFDSIDTDHKYFKVTISGTDYKFVTSGGYSQTLTSSKYSFTSSLNFEIRVFKDPSTQTFSFLGTTMGLLETFLGLSGQENGCGPNGYYSQTFFSKINIGEATGLYKVIPASSFNLSKLATNPPGYVKSNAYELHDTSGNTHLFYNNGYYSPTNGQQKSSEVFYWNGSGNCINIKKNPSDNSIALVTTSASIESGSYAQVLLEKTTVRSSTFEKKTSFSSGTPNIYLDDNDAEGPRSYSAPSLISSIESEELIESRGIVFGAGEGSSEEEYSDVEGEESAKEYGLVQIEEMPDLHLPSNMPIEARNKIKYSSSNENVAAIVYYNHDIDYGTDTAIDSPESATGLLKPKLRIYNVGESIITAEYPEPDEYYDVNKVEYKLIVKYKKLPKLSLDNDEFEITREVATIIDEDIDNINADPVSSNQTFQSPTPNVIAEETIPIAFEYSTSNPAIGEPFGDLGVILIYDVGTIKVTIKLKETDKFKSSEIYYTLKINPAPEKTPTILTTEEGYYKVRFKEYTDKPIYRIYDMYGDDQKHLVIEINSVSKFKKLQESGADLQLVYTDPQKRNIKEYLVTGITYHFCLKDGKTEYTHFQSGNSSVDSIELLFEPEYCDQYNGDVMIFDWENIRYNEELTEAWVSLNCNVVYDASNVEAYYIFDKALSNRLKKDSNSFKKGEIEGTYIDNHLQMIVQKDDAYVSYDTYPTYSANFETYGVIVDKVAYKHVIPIDVEGKLEEVAYDNGIFYVDTDNAIRDVDQLMVKHNYNDDNLKYQIFKSPITSNNEDEDVKYTFSSSVPTIAEPNESGDVMIYKIGKVKIMANSSETENFTAGETGYILDIIEKEWPILEVPYRKYLYNMDLTLLENVFEKPEIKWTNNDPDAKLLFYIKYAGTVEDGEDIYLTEDDLEGIINGPDEENDDELLSNGDDIGDDTETETDTESETETEPKVYTYRLELGTASSKKFVGYCTNELYERLKADGIGTEANASGGKSFIIPNNKYAIIYYGPDGTTKLTDLGEAGQVLLDTYSGVNNLNKDFNITGDEIFQIGTLMADPNDTNGAERLFINGTDINSSIKIDKKGEGYEISVKLKLYPVFASTGKHIAYFLKSRTTSPRTGSPAEEDGLSSIINNCYYTDSKLIRNDSTKIYRVYSDDFTKNYINITIDGVTQQYFQLDSSFIEENKHILKTQITTTRNCTPIGSGIKFIYGGSTLEEEETTETETLPEETHKKIKLTEFKKEIEVKQTEVISEGVTEDRIYKVDIDTDGNIHFDNGLINQVFNVLVKSVETDNYHAKYLIYNVLVSPTFGSNQVVINKNEIIIRIDPNDENPEDIYIPMPEIKWSNTDPEVQIEYLIYDGGPTDDITVKPWYSTTFAVECTRPQFNTATTGKPRIIADIIGKDADGNFRYTNNYKEGSCLDIPNQGGNTTEVDINDIGTVYWKPQNKDGIIVNRVINCMVYFSATENFNESCVFYNIIILPKEESKLTIDTKVFKVIQPDNQEVFPKPNIITNNTDTTELKYYYKIFNAGRISHNIDSFTEDDGVTIAIFGNQDGFDYWEEQHGHYCYTEKEENDNLYLDQYLPYCPEKGQMTSADAEDLNRNVYPITVTKNGIYASDQTPSGDILFILEKNGQIKYSNKAARYVLNIWCYTLNTTNFKTSSVFYNLEVTVKDKPMLGVFPPYILVRPLPEPQYIEAPKVVWSNDDKKAKLLYQFDLDYTNYSTWSPTPGSGGTITPTPGPGTPATPVGPYANVTLKDNGPFHIDDVGNITIDGDPSDPTNSINGFEAKVRVISIDTPNYGYIETYYIIKIQGKKEVNWYETNATVIPPATPTPITTAFTYTMERTVMSGVDYIEAMPVYHDNTDLPLNIYYISSDTSIVTIDGNGRLVSYKTTQIGTPVKIKIHIDETTNFKVSDFEFDLVITEGDIPLGTSPLISTYPTYMMFRTEVHDDIYIKGSEVECTNTDPGLQIVYSFQMPSIGNPNILSNFSHNGKNTSIIFTDNNNHKTITGANNIVIDQFGNIKIPSGINTNSTVSFWIISLPTENFGPAWVQVDIEFKEKMDPPVEFTALSANLTRTVVTGSEVHSPISIKPTTGPNAFRYHQYFEEKPKIIYKSSDTSVVEVTPRGTLIIYKIGNATISIEASETENFKPLTSKSYSINITQQAITIS